MNTLARYEQSEKRKARELYRVQCPTMIANREYGTVWLEMYGPEQSVRAIAFHIKGHPDLKGRRTMQQLTNLHYYNEEGGTTSMLQFDPGTVPDYKMITITKDHEPGFITMLFIHPWFSRMEQRFILGGTVDEPSPWFANAFQKVVPIPFMESWTEELWKAAVNKGLVQPLDSTKLAWQINSSKWQWQRLVESMIKAGTLHG